MNRYWPPILAALLIVNIGVTTVSLLRPVPAVAAPVAIDRDLDRRLEQIEDTLIDIEVDVDLIEIGVNQMQASLGLLEVDIDRIEGYIWTLYRACDRC